MSTPNADPKPDFTVEIDKVRGVTYYTPESYAAHDWCHGTPEGAQAKRKGGMDGVITLGRSFMFKSDNARATKLRGFLKGEGFVVVVRSI